MTQPCETHIQELAGPDGEAPRGWPRQRRDVICLLLLRPRNLHNFMI